METKEIRIEDTPNISIVDTLKGWFSKEFKEPFVSLFLCTTGDLLTGIAMGIFTSNLKMLPALIILIPAAIGMRGNIFASLGSRLGTYLHTGQITPDFKKSRILNQNVSSSATLTLITSIYLGILATLVAGIIGLEADVVDMLLISTAAGFLSAVIMLIFTVVIAFLSYRRGWDPDNMTAPLITLVGDMLTLPFLFVSLIFVLGITYEIKMMFLAVIVILTLITIPYSLSEKSKPYYSNILRESLPVLLVCGFLGIFSGAILGGRIEGLIAVPSILIMLPAFLEDGGAIGGILAARLSSSLHLGSIETKKGIPKNVLKMFVTMHILGIIIFTMVGSFAYIIAKFLGISSLPLHLTIAVSLLAGEMLIVVVNLIAYYISIISFKRGVDPDNVTIPTITSTIDLIGTACLIAVLIIMGMI
ncbi:MAG: magnesium transporter [Thermoplasmata archaeon]|nr:magnesium transporter [Thermoplasmata archaeon]